MSHGMKRTFSNRCVTIKTKKEMKKNLFMVAAVALMAMVSCNKEEINGGNDVVDTVKPSVTVEFVASVEAETKTTLVGEAGKKRTEWVAGDAISINGVKFVTEEAGAKVVFTNAEELPSDFAAPFTAVYPYGADGVPAAQTAVAGNFDPKAVIETATSDNYSLSFKNSTSLLKFQVPAACKTVSVSSDTELAGKAGAYAKEVTLSGDFVTGKDYYIAVIPGTKANFVVRIDGYLSKNVASVTIDKSTIANMKTLPAAVESKTYGIAGTMQNPTPWDAANPMVMYEDVDGVLLKNIELYKDDEFKIVLNKSWDNAVGNGGSNMTIDKNGIFDIFFDTTTKDIRVSCIEEFTDLTVDITINNKANWTPLYLYLESDGKAITSDNGDLVSNNVYSVSGNYIGSSLQYCFISGTNKTEKASVTITKSGATVAVEATVIKLTFMLDTDNAKQWFGNTAKIHFWNTGSIDTSWPGNEMTFDGNHTWHINIPSELAGKTINYKIHNGSGWESKDSSVKINAAGNTVKGSSIGIN